MIALVDIEDFERLGHFNWIAMKAKNLGHYAGRYVRNENGIQCRLFLHAEIMGCKGVDHINGDRLDCRRSNLRLAGVAQNAKNRAINRNSSTGFKGVWWNKRLGKWTATIQSDRVRKELGVFCSKYAAAIAYNIAAIHLHGEFARLNDVFSGRVDQSHPARVQVEVAA